MHIFGEFSDLSRAWQPILGVIRDFISAQRVGAQAAL
jgi:hypothetical protein